MTNDDKPTDAPDASLLPPPRPFGASRGDHSAPAQMPEAMRHLLLHDGLAVALLGFDGAVRDMSGPMLELIGAADITDVRHDSSPGAALRSLLDHLPSEVRRGEAPPWHGRIEHRDTAGRDLVFRVTATATNNSSTPGGGGLALVLHDITTTDDQMRRLLQRATRDPLTRLANRRQIIGQLARTIGGARSGHGSVAVIQIGLDDLASVNEAFGQSAGDRLLASSAQRLDHAVRPVDGVGRIAGDEFLVVAADLSDPDAALELADRARRALAGRLHIDGIDVELSASVGVAVVDVVTTEYSDDELASLAMGNVAAAMAHAKSTGRNRCSLFSSEMRSTTRERSELGRALATALADGDLTVDYQTIRSAMSGAAVAVEALVRWTHPTIGPVDARKIIEVAEASGAIERLGADVLGQALGDLERWQTNGDVDSTFAVHVNVSRTQLESSSFVDSVVDQLRLRGMEPARLVLEIRESPLLGRESDLTRSIRALRRVGVHVAVDNFGTGTKALEVLTDVGADVLKLDGSLALPAGSSDADDRLVRSVVALAHALDIDVVAERVTGRDQLARLRAAGCDMVQGNLLSPPTSADAVDFSASTLL